MDFSIDGLAFEFLELRTNVGWEINRYLLYCLGIKFIVCRNITKILK